MGRHSLTLRLTLLFAVAATAVLLALGFLVGRAVEQHFEEQDLDLLRGKLALARHALAKVRSAADLDALPQQLDDSLIGHHGLAVAIVGPQGETLFATSGAAFPKPLIERRTATPSQPLICG